MTILVTGGTGVLGRCVVGRLVAAGHRVRVLSRDASRSSTVTDVELCVGDLRALASLRPALSDVDVVVHCASDVRSPDEVDVAGTSNLVEAMRGLDVGHLVYVLIVGVDQIPITYYRAKRDVESIIKSESVPWTIQRTTQFLPFVAEMLATSARWPFIACPTGLRFQPIAVEQVANRVAHHVEAGAAGKAADLGGPEVLTLHDLASTWLAAAGRRRRILLPVPFSGAAGRAFKDGANLCAEQSSAGPTWTQFLEGGHSSRGALR